MRSFEIGHKQPAECCSAVEAKEGGNNKTRSDTRRSIVGDIANARSMGPSFNGKTRSEEEREGINRFLL